MSGNISIWNFRTVIVEARPTLDTSAYASGDTLFDRLALTVPRCQDALRGTLKGVTILDKDDQGAAIDLYLLKGNVAFGTANAAPSISDADGEAILGYVPVTASKDLGGCRFGQTDAAVGFSLAAGEALYLAAVVNGTPTHTAAGLVIRLSLELENQ